MLALIRGCASHDHSPEELATRAYAMADALIAERQKLIDAERPTREKFWKEYCDAVYGPWRIPAAP